MAKIAAAMSGGVDSAVAAALLREQGHQVFGITLKLYDDNQSGDGNRNSGDHVRKGACCAGQDIRDARRVAQQLEIPHYVFDYQELFRRQVIEPFADAYLSGETPIPCIPCNSRVKFGYLLEAAEKIGAEALATGHYTRICQGKSGPELHKAIDERKDQSYYMFSTPRSALDKIRFPLGDIESKTRTRAFAEKLGLAVANKPDSSDICFVADGDYASFIERLRPDAMAPGEIVSLDGKILGEHAGVSHFTVGQRRGVGVDGQKEPLFVIRIDQKNRRIYVGPREALQRSTLIASDVNWLGDRPFEQAPKQGWPVLARIRSTRTASKAFVRPIDKGRRAQVDFEQAEEAIAPGQACVFYAREGTRLLGGGWIMRN